jgi:hypothetical protein
MQRLTSRKFILAMLALLSASVLCYCGQIADGVYATVTVSTVGAYITGNVLQKDKVATNVG